MMKKKGKYGSFFLLYAICIAWTWWAGKDINWDLVNYHFYGPSLFLGERWQKDFFAASIQSYLNPAVYVPFFLMVNFEWNDFLIAGVLSSFHFLSIVLCWVLFGKIIEPKEKKEIALFLIAASLALACPLLLLLLGSTFSDPVTAPLILAALLFLISDPTKPFFVFLSGFLVGVAVGFKLTNGAFAIGLGVTLFLQLFFNRSSFRGICILLTLLALGGMGGFLLIHGYWSWKLWIEFGNPFFPFFNGIFESPDYPLNNIHDLRFLDSGFWGAFTLPFDMARSETWVYNEASTPDIRFAALVLLVVPIFFKLLTRRSQIVNREKWGKHKNLAAVSIFFITSYFVWALSSRIGRYALPLLILVGPLFVAWSLRVANRRYAIAMAAIVLCLQTYITYANDVSRWTPTAWTGKWFDFSIPNDLHQESTFVTIDAQTFSAIAPFLPSNSSFANLIGMYTMPVERKMPKQIKRILGNKNVYLIYAAGLTKGDSPAYLSEKRWASISDKIAAYGFGPISRKNCEEGSLRLDTLPRFTHEGSVQERRSRLLFCELKKLDSSEANFAVKKTQAWDALFDKIEDTCIGRFDPIRSQTIRQGDQYLRSYFNSATALYLEKGAFYATGYRSLDSSLVGVVDSNGIGLKDIFCPKKIMQRYLK